MITKLITPPAVEPISLQDAKDFLRVDIGEDDDLITSLIVTARELAETMTRRALVTQTWRLTADEFPRALGNGVWRFGGRNSGRDQILLPYPPLQSVSSIEYQDENGDTQTMDPENYLVDTDREPARITLPDLGIWPVTACVAGAVTITFVAGYGVAAAVPAAVKTFMKMKVRQLYDMDGDESASPMINAILDPLCWGSYS